MVSLTNFYRNEIRLIHQKEAVISDEFAETHFLPHIPGAVLVSDSVILRQGQSPQIFKLTHGVHLVILGIAIGTVVLVAPAIQILGGAHLQNKVAVNIHVIAYVEELLGNNSHFVSIPFIFWIKVGKNPHLFSVFWLSFLN